MKMDPSFDAQKTFENRGCTDIICLLIFLACIFSMGYLSFYGIKNGQIERIMSPSNGNLNFCGLDNNFDLEDTDDGYDEAIDMRGYPNLYIG